MKLFANPWENNSFSLEEVVQFGKQLLSENSIKLESTRLVKAITLSNGLDCLILYFLSSSLLDQNIYLGNLSYAWEDRLDIPTLELIEQHLLNNQELEPTKYGQPTLNYERLDPLFEHFLRSINELTNTRLTIKVEGVEFIFYFDNSGNLIP